MKGPFDIDGPDLIGCSWIGSRMVTVHYIQKILRFILKENNLVENWRLLSKTLNFATPQGN